MDITEENVKKTPLEELTPKEIVKQLDTYIIGQHKAKKSVAIALRNRTRRLKLPEEIRDEIAPKNILMIGPTGVGKTEIARRLAKLCGAPFLKVEATKYTEVGYVGRDVESMIRDLMAVGYNMVKAEFQENLKAKAAEKVEETLLDLLLPGSGPKKVVKKARDNEVKQISDFSVSLGNIFENAEKQQEEDVAEEEKSSPDTNGGNMSETREKFRAMLREGRLEDRQVEVSQRRQARIPSFEIFAGGNMEEMESAMQGIAAMISGPSGGAKRRSVTVKEAREILMEDQLDRMTDPDKVADEARNRVQQMGIVFIDEIDKIAAGASSRSGQDVSREGVQRDILPIVEGSTVNTKFGVIDTTHILFIAAGAFNVSKPSDLIPELQGRFPLRVELDSLNAEDFKKILTEPKNALTKQYVSLLETEGVTVNFTEEAIDRMSSLAADVNARVENIGARRLHTIMETLLEDLSFEADEHKGEIIDITADYVDERLKGVVQDQDLSKYIL